MEGNRLESAVDRMTTAMDRLEAVLATRPAQAAASPSTPNELGLIAQHETMKSDVRETLAALDELISGLEK